MPDATTCKARLPQKCKLPVFRNRYCETHYAEWRQKRKVFSKNQYAKDKEKAKKRKLEEKVEPLPQEEKHDNETPQLKNENQKLKDELQQIKEKNQKLRTQLNNAHAQNDILMQAQNAQLFR